MQTGKNKLTIEVVNTWVNRLIGDAILTEQGKSQKHTSTTYSHYNKNSALSESGLIGPVRLLEVIN